MKKNMGSTDRIIRIILVLVVVFLGYYFDLWVLYILALILFVTAVIGVCPLYIPLNISTNKK